ncbi:D-alanyl-D-alanine carboxypeptidase family protein [Eubacterium multiforme]|uniref:serine-type D-Ala-D-Ala carboxypeptidase n=1 Tax=Eubacterium multiforme TaxID=83339 RepID=A0ABT9URC4_9FIRM|nr:D-alanyl-D-alanine carboxypeptidase family protein [Eubacterium multiforme]MDQ0148678.1 D-alanyl-D-alanine carboxypeptidase [Eubacterium multiforme]
MRKFLNSFIKFLLLIPIFYSLILNTANAAEKPPKINAESSILIDANTGQVLYSKDENAKHFPASTTKILTALVILDNTNLKDVVTIGHNPPFADGSSIGLKEGEKFTVETLLTGLLLESGNDCAEALAEHVGGSIKNFAKMMNEKAKELGCNDSNFENPSGLPNNKHVTTAHDLALIMRAALDNPNYIKISRIVSTQLPASNLDGEKRWVNNHNYLLNKNSKYYYKYTLAGKSGYTDVARHTFVISGEKNGERLIAVFLKANDKVKNYKDMANLLDYGFNNFKEVKLYSKNEVIENLKITKDLNLPIVLGNNVLFATEKSNNDSINKSLKYKLPRNVKRKTLKKGDVICEADVLVNGKKISTVNLLSGVNREYNFKTGIFEFVSNNLIEVIIGSIVSLTIILFIIISIIKKRKRNKFHKKWKHVINRQK